MRLTDEQRTEIKERFDELTTGESPMLKTRAWRTIAEEMEGVSYGAIRYWTDEKSRAAYLRGSAYHKESVQRHRSKPEAKQRRARYQRLRDSHLAREVIPDAYQKAGKQSLTLSELSDLVESNTSFQFGEDTLHRLLIDRYEGKPRGPPIVESPEEPGHYKLRQEFYQG